MIVAADLVAACVEEDRYWVLPHPHWMEMTDDRWTSIVEGSNPEGPTRVPGMPSAEELRAQMAAAMEDAPET